MGDRAYRGTKGQGGNKGAYQEVELDEVVVAKQWRQDIRAGVRGREFEYLSPAPTPLWTVLD